jgi:hypothetical protein
MLFLLIHIICFLIQDLQYGSVKNQAEPGQGTVRMVLYGERTSLGSSREGQNTLSLQRSSLAAEHPQGNERDKVTLIGSGSEHDTSQRRRFKASKPNPLTRDEAPPETLSKDMSGGGPVGVAQLERLAKGRPGGNQASSERFWLLRNTTIL